MVARPNFDMELQELNLEIIKMGTMVENAIEKSIKAFKDQDKDAAKAIMEYDDEIDEIEKRIEGRCLSLLLRQQPVARDLRKISTALKMITDMERIGDNAADIAELSMHIEGEHIYTMVKNIPEMSRIAREMVHDSISSFVNNDVVKAKDVQLRDDQVDMLFEDVKQELVELLKEPGANYGNAIEFLMIAKYLERIADHAVNIGEWVEFLETGEHKSIRIL